MKGINARILVVDDEKVIQEGCKRVLANFDYLIDIAGDGETALEMVGRNGFDVILLDLKLPGLGGMEVLRLLKDNDPETIVVMITGYPSIEGAVEAIKLGAYDYIPKPFSPDQLRIVIKRALERKKLLLENEYLRRELKAKCESEIVIGKSKAMQRIYELVRKVAPTDSNVLLYGESGTGKELIAKAIHNYSHREGKEFVPVDCSSLVEALLESELFGHVKGSFTGAVQTKHGSFELANGGTFFFDEISNLSLSIQAKLLRVLQEREIKPVGGTKRINVDIRIIAATNRDLRKSIISGTFREDLFYRLNVVPITLPPLRERKEDIPLLAHHFLALYNRKRKKPLLGISPDVIDLLLKSDWPGNVRELENTIERALVLADNEIILPRDLPWYINSKEGGGNNRDIYKTLEEVEREHIRMVLRASGYHRGKASKIMGINRKTLYQKIKKYGLE
ncbi:MAG: sigma-54 dependent transcriptional regulator [Thermodesulfobacteriota bacterium]|nr:sigma-54 dependent transcriptional regulator [Thermodesulfobacteriota bacterium]